MWEERQADTEREAEAERGHRLPEGWSPHPMGTEPGLARPPAPGVPHLSLLSGEAARRRPQGAFCQDQLKLSNRFLQP